MTKKFTQRKIGGVIVDSDVPMPEFMSSYKGWPFLDMEVGESFIVKAEDVNKVRAAGSYAGSRHNRKFAVRKVDASGESFRCWRTA